MSAESGEVEVPESRVPAAEVSTSDAVQAADGAEIPRGPEV
jgi:hypothetical protein